MASVISLVNAHIDRLHSALSTSIPWMFATFADVLMGGWSVDKLIQHGRDASFVRQSILIGGTLLGLAMLGAADAQTATAALIWITTAIAGLSAAAPVALCTFFDSAA